MADNPNNKYKILQTIGKTIGGGVRGDWFNLEYQVLFLEFKLELKNRIVIAFPIKGCNIKNMKKIILPIIIFYLEYKKIEI